MEPHISVICSSIATVRTVSFLAPRICHFSVYSRVVLWMDLGCVTCRYHNHDHHGPLTVSLCLRTDNYYKYYLRPLYIGGGGVWHSYILCVTDPLSPVPSLVIPYPSRAFMERSKLSTLSSVVVNAVSLVVRPSNLSTVVHLFASHLSPSSLLHFLCCPQLPKWSWYALPISHPTFTSACAVFALAFAYSSVISRKE
jgi:hypothetical protein